MLWQNLHPSVSVAAVALAAAAGVGWLRFFAKYRPSPPWLLTALLMLAGAATFATPAGFSILSVSAYNARASLALEVNEWLPPWEPVNRAAGLTFAASVVVFAWLGLRNRERTVWEELAPAAALFVLTLTAHRFALFWELPLCQWSHAIFPTARMNPSARPNRPSRRATGLTPVGYSSASHLIATAIALADWFAPHISTKPCAHGHARLKETRVAGPIYCYYAWGGPLIDAGYPDWAVAFDGPYRYSPEEWETTRAVRGEIGLEELEQLYHPACIPLPRGWTTAHCGTAERWEWREVHADKTCVVFVRSP